MNPYTEPQTESKLKPLVKHRDFYCEPCHRWYSLEEVGWCEDCGRLICEKHHKCPWKGESEED